MSERCNIDLQMMSGCVLSLKVNYLLSYLQCNGLLELQTENKNITLAPCMNQSSWSEQKSRWCFSISNDKRFSDWDSWYWDREHVLNVSECALPHKINICGPQIWITEIEYYQKMSSHAQIRPQGAEKQLIVKLMWWWVVGGMQPIPVTAIAF